MYVTRFFTQINETHHDKYTTNRLQNLLDFVNMEISDKMISRFSDVRYKTEYHMGIRGSTRLVYEKLK